MLAFAVQNDPAKKAILVIDDDRAIREALRFALESEGYQVLTASDGQEGG
jgi:CheY-like chemotaxis protein